MKKILVTGGAGYIGSHTVVRLIEEGYKPIVFDNFVNSSYEVINRIERITGTKPICIEGDICLAEDLTNVFSQHEFHAVIHFAGLKAVGESVEQPLRYYQNNVNGALVLLDVMQQFDCRRIVFSSSATVYGDPASVPISEDFPLRTTNPYGQTKLMIEEILRDVYQSNQNWQISILRYFNPVAAHPSGLIGDDPNGIPNNLMPFVAQVAVGMREKLSVFGDDYETVDGTGVRDYIHVMDLANAHLKALDALNSDHGCEAYNIGTGQGYSVLQMINAFERASGRDIPYKVEGRRAGDIAECFALPALSQKRLGWQAEYDLDKMMEDHWRWQFNNPNGYKS